VRGTNFKIGVGKTFLAAVSVVMAAGCMSPNIDRTGLDEPNPTVKINKIPLSTDAVAGAPVGAGSYVVALLPLHPRQDPFALLPNEDAYEKQQMAAYFATTYGGWPLFYPGPPAPPPLPPVEEQPHRRLAGILIGDSITALIDMGDGNLQDIHPGEAIPNSEWTVESIDEEKAVLRRTVPGKLPSEVIVRLESVPGNGNTTTQDTNQPPGFPGGPPGGGFGPNGPGGPGRFGAPGQFGGQGRFGGGAFSGPGRFGAGGGGLRQQGGGNGSD
jgi:hypothetical protein